MHVFFFNQKLKPCQRAFDMLQNLGINLISKGKNQSFAKSYGCQRIHEKDKNIQNICILELE